ncbi:MAG: hypothetical protein RIT10_564 [Bacteroidota bacterium]|jgi:hypothetical protein
MIKIYKKIKYIKRTKINGLNEHNRLQTNNNRMQIVNNRIKF